MNILATNDDGFDAPGFRALLAAMDGLGEIMSVAPEKNHSGASSSLTLGRDIGVRQYAPGHYRVCGTPVDCVHLALTGDFLPAPPDLIVSGVNDGANMGDDTIYSGTVAAVIEGHLFGVPGFAFSMAGKSGRHFADGGAVARYVVSRFCDRPFAGLPLLNINIPDATADDPADIVATRLGRRHRAQAAIRRGGDENGGHVFVIGEAGAARDDAPGTDFHAVEQGRISASPLMIDLTDTPEISRLLEWLAH
ncbi:MAG: 5'/3'-nucleotidase SurE [Gammaproteobacteria bacterium]